VGGQVVLILGRSIGKIKDLFLMKIMIQYAFNSEEQRQIRHMHYDLNTGGYRLGITNSLYYAAI
jgi:hypothetical protein